MLYPAHVSARHWATDTSTSTTETEPHVSPGHLSGIRLLHVNPHEMHVVVS